MFGLFKKKNKVVDTTTSPGTNSKTKVPEVNENELLKKSTVFYKEGNISEAIDAIDVAIDSYTNKGELSNAFPAYKKKASYLLKSGRNDESWRLYNEMVVIYSNDIIFLPQVYDEMRKQLEYEKKYLDALEKALLATLLKHKSQLIQNHKYQDNTFDVDFEWEQDDKLQKLAKKAEVNWESIKKILVKEYSNVDHETDFNKIYLKVREELKE